MKKNTIKYIIAVVLSVVFMGCSEKQEIYDTQTCWLNFKLATRADTLISYSFVYSQEGTLTDTIWIKLETSGHMKDYDRKISLSQLKRGNMDAVGGKDYITFTDPAYTPFYILPAGKNNAVIPVVVRWNAMLEQREVSLVIAIQANEDFQPGFAEPSTIKIRISDQLSKPSNWNSNLEEYIPYGKVKHEFLIRVTGEKWDYAYLSGALGFEDISEEYPKGTNSDYDIGYMTYLVGFLKRELDKENAERLRQGLKVLEEADGTIVTIE